MDVRKDPNAHVPNTVNYRPRMTDSGTRRFREPEVSILAVGGKGYVVTLYGIDGEPADLREFNFDPEGKRADRHLVGREARAYRDGVAEGIFRASLMLSDLIGAGQ